MAELVVRLQQAPYGNAQAADGIDFAVAATNYGHQVKLVFEGDGVFQLLADQAPPQGIKNHAKRLKSLVFYDIEQVYVCQASARRRGLDGAVFCIETEALDQHRLTEIYTHADHVVTF